MNPFDEIQANYRDDPWNESGKRFGIIEHDTEARRAFRLYRANRDDAQFQEDMDRALHRGLGIDLHE